LQQQQNHKQAIHAPYHEHQQLATFAGLWINYYRKKWTDIHFPALSSGIQNIRLGS
jgi:hypothetical protein